jgi:hypothetical protein
MQVVLLQRVQRQASLIRERQPRMRAQGVDLRFVHAGRGGQRQIECAGQQRQPHRRLLRGRGQQRPGFLQHDVDAVVAVVRVAVRVLQRRAAAQPRHHRLRPGAVQAARGHLEGQRQAGDALAQFLDALAMPRGVEAGVEPVRAGRQQPGRGRRGRAPAGIALEGQAAQLQQPFAAATHARARRREHGDARGARQHGEHQRARGGHRLQVVQHQQQRAGCVSVAAGALEHALRQAFRVAQRAALVAAAEPQRAAPEARAQLGRCGHGQPRLADAPGANHREPAALGQREPLAQQRQLAVAAEQRAALGLACGQGRRLGDHGIDLFAHRARRGIGPAARLVRRCRLRRPRVGRPAGAGRIGMDARVQGVAIGRWPRAQPLGQRGAAGFVLRNGRDALAARGQQAHQRDVCRLVGIVDLEHAVGMLDRVVEFAGLDAALHQVAPQGDRGACGALASLDQPALEVVAGCHVEAVEQRAAPGARGRGALGHRPAAVVHGLLQRLQVHRHRRARDEADLLRVDVQQVGQPAPQARQRDPQIGPRGRLVVEIAPQQAGQPPARHRPALGRQVEHQRLVLGRHQARERLAVELQPRRSEQQYPQTLQLRSPDTGATRR